MTNRDHIINLCGATQALASQTKMMTDKELADIYDISRLLSKLLDDTRKELMARCKAHGNAGGLILRPVNGAREIKDIRGAYIALRDIIPKEEFLKACSISVTKLENAFVAVQIQKRTFRDYIISRQEFSNILGPVLRNRPEYYLLTKAPFAPMPPDSPQPIPPFPTPPPDDDIL